METHPFSPYLFYPVLCKWLAERGHLIPPQDEIPAIGWIALNDNHIVAMAFLRRMEGGKAAMLDGLATNPQAPPSDRHYGLTKVVDAVLKTAKELGVENVIAWTRDESVLKRSISHGFKQYNHTVIVHSVQTDES